MKAYVCSKYGAADVLKITTCHKPNIKSNEVLIKVYSTSVTNSDIFIRSSKVAKSVLIPFRIMIGVFRPRKKIIGQVFAGVIEQLGSQVKRLKVGSNVYGLTGFSLGAYAEYLKLAEAPSTKGCVSVMPENVSFEEATAAAYGGLLALQFLEEKDINQGDKVLVYGASSTSGLFAIQYLKHLGADVTAVCSKEKVPFVQSFGVSRILDYKNDESIQKLDKYHVIFDCVGKAKTSSLKEACKDHVIDKEDFISIDDAALILSSDRLDRVARLVESKIITPVNDRMYSFEQMVEAHEYVELGHKKGNVAVTVTEAQ